MQCSAQLVELTRNPGKIKITTKITTATRSSGLACTAFVYAVIPQRAKRKGADAAADDAADRATAAAAAPPTETAKGAARAPATVPTGAERVAEHALLPSSGRHYAYLSGDFNPIHWVPRLAKMSGFPTCILHGFAQMVRHVVCNMLCRGRESALSSGGGYE
jgi:hypothetical protein